MGQLVIRFGVPVPGWPGYTVSKHGVVYGKRGQPLSGVPHHRTRHLRIRLYGPLGNCKGTKGGKYSNLYIHQVVCMTFHGPPPFEGALVRHLDNDCSNNRPENLAWGDHFDNAHDYWSDEAAVAARNERRELRKAEADPFDTPLPPLPVDFVYVPDPELGF